MNLKHSDIYIYLCLFQTHQNTDTMYMKFVRVAILFCIVLLAVSIVMYAHCYI